MRATNCYACDVVLKWPTSGPALSPFARCGNCAMPNFIHVRSLPPPMVPLVPDALRVAGARGVLYAPLVEILPAHVRPLAVDDFRWSCLRLHPWDPQVVVVTRFEVVLALLPIRQALFLRALCLLSFPGKWSVHSSVWRVFESDLHAHIIAMLVSAEPADWPMPPERRFRGDCHVFPPWHYKLEPGFLRPASLPLVTGDIPLGCPSTSAFADVHRFRLAVTPGGARSVVGCPLSSVIGNSHQLH